MVCMRSGWKRIGGAYLYFALLLLLLALASVLYYFGMGEIGPEAARVYVDALGMVATLALLYFAYVNIVSARYENVASAELAVRPILAWELSGEGGRAALTYHAVKHPIYDLRAEITVGKGRRVVEERHIDVLEANPQAKYSHDMTQFVRDNLKNGEGKLCILISYHSELGGKYDFEFSKEVSAKGRALQFHHRKILWGKYPWKEERTYFE